MPSLPTVIREKEILQEDYQRNVYSVVHTFEEEDRYFRERRIRLWRKLQHYFHGQQYLFWSDAHSDWLYPGHGDYDVNDNDEESAFDESLYNRVINIFKAHGETIISALGTTIPSLVFYPEDADVPDDVSTAKAYNQISELCKKRTKFELTFLKAVFILWIEDFVAAYNYSEDDKKRVTRRPKMGMVNEARTTNSCPQCEADVAADSTDCPECFAQFDAPESQTTTEKVEKQVDWEEVAKKVQKIEVYGPTHVRVPAYAQNLEECPYLIFTYDQHVTVLKHRYPDWEHEIKEDETEDTYEKWSRRPYDDFEDTNNLVTVKACWLRPAAYRHLDTEDVEKLDKEFPDGLRAIFLNDTLVELIAEEMDDHWTISYNPTSKYIHGDPLGEPLVDVQELKNDLVNLTSQTIEYGIPETYVESNLLDWDAYRQRTSRPGQVTPIKTVPGQPAAAGFFETRPATLSREVNLFTNSLELDGQFVTGALPSIFGGGLQSGSSRTAAEYAQSKNMALQRLNVRYDMLVDWTVRTFEKVTKAYAADMAEDERIPEKQGNGFKNTVIRLADLAGKVGRVDAEGSDTFPNTWAQKRDTVMELLNLGSEQFSAMLFHPNNTHLLKSTLGLYDFYIPGEDSRNKQWAEIEALMNAEPIPGQPQPQQMMGSEMMPGQDLGQSVEEPGFEQPGIPPQQLEEPPLEPSLAVTEIDDHAIEVEVCSAFLNSERGQELRAIHPQGYLNVVLHMKQHIAFHQQQQAPAEEQQSSEQTNGLEDTNA